jgi:hypothetical protein
MKRFQSGVQFGSRGPDIYALRQAAKGEPAEFMRKTTALIEGGKLKLTDFRDLRPLYAGLADVLVPVRMPIGGAERAITASAFPLLIGNLVIAAMNDRYTAIETIGQELVTDIEDSSKVTTMASVHSLDKNVEEVKETDDFPEIGGTEESVEIRHKRNGRKLSISAEMIEENRVADIVERVNALSEISNDWIEEQTLSRVTDHHGSKASASEPYVYRPEGSGTALFSATANTPGTRAPLGTRKNSNAFADESDLEASRLLLNSMRNNRGKRISIPNSERILLVPDAIVGEVLKVYNSEYVPGVENELSNWGPRGNFRPARILSSPKLDDLSASAWYYGAPKRQFRRKWKLMMEYVTLGNDTQAYLNSRIAFQARIAWDVEIGAIDYVYWIQNLAATTAPADE